MKGVKCQKLSYLFGLVCLLSLSICLSVSSSVSAAVPGSESVAVYTAYQSGNTWGDESIATTPVNNKGQMVLYPTNMQKGAIFRLLFYPVLQVKSSVKGIILKDVDVSFYIEDPYADSTVPDHNLCTAPHIVMGNTSGWTSKVSNCHYWDGWDGDTQYTHYHFDLVFSGENSINITSSDTAPFFITLGTNGYNESTHTPIYERALYASTAPVYFNSISYGSIQYTTSSTDALLQEVISHQDATTGAIEDLEQTTISNTDRTVSAINNLNVSIENAENGEQERWEADKQEESDREEAGQDDADALLSIFDFNLSNPFAPIFDSFTNQQCVNIPTIAGWLHLNNSQYCSWWSQSIRDTLTPAFGIFSTMILFGFIIHWLRDGSGSQIPTGEKGIVYKPHF